MKRFLLAVWLTAGLVASAANPVTIGLANSGVAAGTYSNAVITVDVWGRITSATSGLGNDISALTNSINGGFPNGTGALIHWSQLFGVPAGFADGTDDGTGGGSLLVNGGTGGTNLVDTADLLWSATGGSISGSLSGLKAAQLWQSTNAALTRLSGIGAGTSGDTYYRDATGWTNLVKGADGMIYIMSGGFPAWSSNITELVVSDLVVSNAFPSYYVSNSTPNRFIISGPTGLFTNDIAETGTGAPVRAASPAFTGDPTAPSPAVGDDDTSLATTAWVKDEFDRFQSDKQYEWMFLDFVGGSAAEAFRPLINVAIASGSYGTYGGDGGSVYRPNLMKGIFYLTTASGTATTTGDAMQAMPLNHYCHTNVSIFQTLACFPATNGTIAYLGYGDLATTTQDTDAIKFAVSNQVVYGSAISNTSETLTSSGYSIQANVYYLWKIAATNNAATFSLSSNGVVVWSDSIASGLPYGDTARMVTPMYRVWNTATAHTNANTIFAQDNVGWKWSK